MALTLETLAFDYFHGGQPGLPLGGRILPPSETGASGTLLEAARRAGLPSPAKASEVYVTTAYLAALMYAVVHPHHGHIYRVEPEGPLRPDLDCREPGLSYACDSARILQRIVPSADERRAVWRALGMEKSAPPTSRPLPERRG